MLFLCFLIKLHSTMQVFGAPRESRTLAKSSGNFCAIHYTMGVYFII